MNSEIPKYILIDASFVSRVKLFDPTCDIIDYFSESIDNSECIITEQYQIAPCNHHSPECDRFEEVFSDENAIMAGMGTQLSVDVDKISRDPVDVKIFLWAKNTENSSVYTCDKNLLEICCKYDIQRLCFKAAVKALDEWFEGALLNGTDFNIRMFVESDDPFINFQIDRRCKTHCNNNPCICLKN